MMVGMMGDDAGDIVDIAVMMRLTVGSVLRR